MFILEILIAFGFTIVGFIGLWLGAGAIVRSVDLISRNLQLSSFGISFLFLGTLTTLPEISILYTSLKDGDLKVSLGNLMGGILVIICLIVPIFGIIKNGIWIKTNFEKNILGLVVLSALVPFILGYDNLIDTVDALIIITCYLFIVYKCIRTQGINTAEKVYRLINSNIKLIDLIKRVIMLPIGLVIIFICSDILFNQILYFANLLNLNTFIISLFVLGLGTNFPEISIMFRAIQNKYSEIAIGDYLGSVVANLLLISLGVFLGGPTLIQTNMSLAVGFALISFGLFYLFFKLNNKLSLYESYILVSLYVIFSFVEFFMF